MHSRPETQELSERSGDSLVLNKGAGMLPVSETNVALVGGSGSTVDGDTGDDETDDGEHLDGGKEELGFAVSPRSKQVDDNDDNEGDGDPDSVRVGGRPEVDQHGDGRDLGGQNDEPVVSVVEGESESPSRVNKSVGERKMTSLNRKVRDH